MADNRSTLLTAKSSQVHRVVVRNEERGTTVGTPLSITSHSLSTSSGLASIDLTWETVDEESRDKLKGEMR